MELMRNGYLAQNSEGLQEADAALQAQFNHQGGDFVSISLFIMLFAGFTLLSTALGLIGLNCKSKVLLGIYSLITVFLGVVFLGVGVYVLQSKILEAGPKLQKDITLACRPDIFPKLMPRLNCALPNWTSTTKDARPLCTEDCADLAKSFSEMDTPCIVLTYMCTETREKMLDVGLCRKVHPEMSPVSYEVVITGGSELSKKECSLACAQEVGCRGFTHAKDDHSWTTLCSLVMDEAPTNGKFNWKKRVPSDPIDGWAGEDPVGECFVKSGHKIMETFVEYGQYFTLASIVVGLVLILISMATMSYVGHVCAKYGICGFSRTYKRFGTELELKHQLNSNDSDSDFDGSDSD